jgi:hypothetical protein
MVLILTWTVVGFFSAIGWHGAQEVVIKPYLTPPAKIEVQKEENK